MFTCDEVYVNVSKAELLSGIPSKKLNFSKFISLENSVIPKNLNSILSKCFSDSKNRPTITSLCQQLSFS